MSVQTTVKHIQQVTEEQSILRSEIEIKNGNNGILK